MSKRDKGLVDKRRKRSDKKISRFGRFYGSPKTTPNLIRTGDLEIHCEWTDGWFEPSMSTGIGVFIIEDF